MAGAIRQPRVISWETAARPSTRYWPGAELADRLEVSPRTLRCDVERLRELGYPVDGDRGVGGGYQLAAGAALPPLVLDDEEAVATAVGLQATAQGDVAGVEEAAVPLPLPGRQPGVRGRRAPRPLPRRA